MAGRNNFIGSTFTTAPSFAFLLAGDWPMANVNESVWQASNYTSRVLFKNSNLSRASRHARVATTAWPLANKKKSTILKQYRAISLNKIDVLSLCSESHNARNCCYCWCVYCFLFTRLIKFRTIWNDCLRLVFFAVALRTAVACSAADTERTQRNNSALATAPSSQRLSRKLNFNWFNSVRWRAQ